MHVALFQPQIPPNTGNIIRLCANTGVSLHLIHPLGFAWDNKRLRRAGMDYQEFAQVTHHAQWQEFCEYMQDRQIWAITTRGQRSLFDCAIGSEDVLLFGSETSGLSDDIHQALKQEQKIRIPMRAQSRSLNLSNSVAVVVYEAIRQNLCDNRIIL